jgi:uncharacterized RDD family membrane protein YckC
MATMKCPVCNHIYPEALERCSRCGSASARRTTAEEASSTLLEFPSVRSQEAQPHADRGAMPDWRAELNEKVRAVKARRSMEARIEAATMARKLAAPPPVAPPPPDPDPPEPTNPIVAAALNRVRRATESVANAKLAASTATAPAREYEEPPVEEPAPAGLFDPAELLADFDELDPIGEEAPDAPVAAEEPTVPDRPRPASLVARAFAGIIDVALLCLISIPFVATVELVDGDFSQPAVQVLLTSTLALVAAFYLFVMLALNGRTIGMGYSRSRVVSAATGEHPEPLAMLARVAGYFLAALPFGLGFAWAALDRERRGLHDLISGTRVVEG